MPCAECNALREEYRAATIALTRAIESLTAAKGTRGFQAALDAQVEAKRACQSTGLALKKHRATHGRSNCKEASNTQLAHYPCVRMSRVVHRGPLSIRRLRCARLH